MAQAPVPVVVVTDGDRTAGQAVHEAAEALGLYVLEKSQGNPTPLDGPALVEAIQRAPRAPVVVMVDDSGEPGRGAGEAALATLLQHPAVRVLGVVAVAANTHPVRGVRPDLSVTADGRRVRQAVDKAGHPLRPGAPLSGDTVDVLRKRPDLVVVGLGDPGKMEGADAVDRGVPRTREALQAVLERSGWLHERAGAPWR
jgi:stage V sporulation protein AE